MVDEIFDRNYQGARGRLNLGFARTFAHFCRTVAESAATLHRIEWSAPWLDTKKKSRRAQRC